MSEDSMKKPLKSPHTVDSTNSSVANNNSSYTSPENGSTILTTGNDNFMAQTLLNYIDALKFDPMAQQDENPVRKDSNLEVEELLGRNKNSGGKKGKGGNAKSKVTFSSNKSSSAYLEQKSLQSQQQLSSKDSGKRDKSKSSTNTVIREWGKRPMLVESEAPWTPRNRMYQRALKIVAKARQQNPGGNPNNFPPQQFTQQPVSAVHPIPPQQQAISMGYPASSGNPQMFFPPNNNLPVGFPYGQVSPVGHQQPVLTGISPMPVCINNRQLEVASDPTSSLYAYPQAGMALPVQRPQSVVYGQLNSQGVWVPFPDQQQLHQQQQRQP